LGFRVRRRALDLTKGQLRSARTTESIHLITTQKENEKRQKEEKKSNLQFKKSFGAVPLKKKKLFANPWKKKEREKGRVGSVLKCYGGGFINEYATKKRRSYASWNRGK